MAASHTDLADFGTGSAAVVVYESQDFRVDADGVFTSVERRVMRVLNLRAAQPYLRASGYENTDESVASISCWSVTPDGRVAQSSNKDIISTAAFAGFELYSSAREKAVTIPGVEEGGWAGYEITRRGRLPLAAEMFLLEDRIPILFSELKVTVASGPVKWFTNYPDRVQVLNASPDSATFRISRRPGIPRESGAPPFPSLAATVFVSYPTQGVPAVDSWSAAARLYQPLFRTAEISSPEIAAEVESISAGKTDALSRLDALYSFVSRSVRYVAIEIGIGGYQPHPAPDVYRMRYGDCKDKATLLITMLQAVGIDARPALIGTRGSVEADPAAPTLATFNHMIVAWPVPEEMRSRVESFASYDPERQILWIDPTSETDPLGELPEMDQGVSALIVYPDRGELRRTPEIKPGRNGVLYNARLVLNAAGSGSTDVEVHYLGNFNSATHSLYRDRSQSELRQMLERKIARYVDAPALTRASVAGLGDNREEIVERFSFDGTFSVASTGDSWFFRPLFLSGLAVAEAGGRPRVHTLDLGSPYSVNAQYRIVLPGGAHIDDLPEDIQVASDFGVLQLNYALDGGTLLINYTVSFIQTRIPPEQYAAFRDFLNLGLRAERQRLRVALK